MLTRASAEPGQSQRQEPHLGLPREWQGPKHLLLLGESARSRVRAEEAAGLGPGGVSVECRCPRQRLHPQHHRACPTHILSPSFLLLTVAYAHNLSQTGLKSHKTPLFLTAPLFPVSEAATLLPSAVSSGKFTSVFLSDVRPRCTDAPMPKSSIGFLVSRPRPRPTFRLPSHPPW